MLTKSNGLKILVQIISSLFSINGFSSLLEPIDPYKELVIVNPIVVEDSKSESNGPWSAGYLFSQMAPKNATVKEKSDLVKSWIQNWMVDYNLKANNHLTEKRDSIEFIILCPWIEASFENKDCKGDLDLKKAPFRLKGIINRVDVGNQTDDSKGEARFVFSLLDAHTETQNSIGATKSFTVIFEYNLTKSPHSLKQWATMWHKLGKYPCDLSSGCEEYKKELQKITKKFSNRTSKSIYRNVPSYLSQIRTNEFQLNSPWQFREFILTKEEDPSRITLKQTSVNQTPQNKFNQNEELAEFIRTNEEKILSGNYKIPMKFRAGSSDSMGEVKWSFPNISENLRATFAKKTCNGCHINETQSISGFYHISPRGKLSPFMIQEAIPERVEILKKILQSP